MEKRIVLFRTKLENYSIYRILQSIHEWITDWLDVCRVFPLVLGFIGWPGLALVFFANGTISAGIVALLIYATYWLHIILFEED